MDKPSKSREAVGYEVKMTESWDRLRAVKKEPPWRSSEISTHGKESGSDGVVYTGAQKWLLMSSGASSFHGSNEASSHPNS